MERWSVLVAAVLLLGASVAVPGAASPDSEASSIALGVPRWRKMLDGGVTFNRFMRFSEIDSYLRSLAQNNPRVKLVQLGRSFEGREMTGVAVSLGGDKQRPAILVDAGIRAREWIGPAAALYLLSQLTDQKNQNLLEDLDWYFLPMLNPDGYEHSHTKYRMWRKNRSNDSDPWCLGVDLNSNFGYHWREVGASKGPCDYNFAGPHAFSEVETQHFRDFVLDKTRQKSIKMYLSLQSFGSTISYPWGYTLDPIKGSEELQAIGEDAAQAMVAAGASRYRVGSHAGLLFPESGSSTDWMAGVAGVEKVFTIKLPGGGGSGFDIEEAKIDEIVRQVFEGVKVFAKYAMKSKL